MMGFGLVNLNLIFQGEHFIAYFFVFKIYEKSQ